MSDATTTQPHGAYPATAVVPDWRHGLTDRCACCGQAIEYAVRPGSPEFGAQAGRGGWRHVGSAS